MSRRDTAVGASHAAVSVQTEDPPGVECPPLSDAHISAISDFLARAAPLVLDALARNVRARGSALEATVGALIAAAADEDASPPGIACELHATWEQPREDAHAPRVDVALPCTGVAWAAGGARIFASFGRRDHAGWCRHAAGIAVWAVGSSARAAPRCETLVELSACATAVAAHPMAPCVFAAGTFDGVVSLWDVSEAGAPQCLATTPVDADYMHRDAIVGLAWAREGGGGGDAYSLRSVSADGRAHAWSLGNAFAFPLASALLLDGDRDVGIVGTARGTASTLALAVGASSLALPLRGADCGATALIGTDAGGILRVNLRVTDAVRAAAGADADGPGAISSGSVGSFETTLPWTRAAVDALSRVPDAAERSRTARAAERFARGRGERGVGMGALWGARPPERALFGATVNAAVPVAHAGARTSAVAASPTVRNLFASAGSDGTLSLCAAPAMHPLVVLSPRRPAGAVGAVNWGTAADSALVNTCALECAAWSAARPLLLATGAANGDVFVFDLFTSTAAEPALTLAPSGALLGSGGAWAGAPPHAWQGQMAAGAAAAVDFSPVAHREVAVGYASGAVLVWKLPALLAAPAGGEMDAAELFVKMGRGEDAEE